MMVRCSKDAVLDASALYLAVKVFDPAVIPVTKLALDAFIPRPPVDCPSNCNAVEMDAAIVVAPDTAKPILACLFAVELLREALTITKAVVPVVTVTAGPTVVRSV
jgi:hypothetical protein